MSQGAAVRPAGLVLTGGASRRLGVPKATLLLEGERLVDRSARALTAVCEPVLEVGPGYGPLSAVQETPPGAGPLAALVAGSAALEARGHEGGVLVVAVDLPRVSLRLLAWLADHHGANVVPRVEGIAQSLCARYSYEARALARRLVDEGERAMRALLDVVPVTYADEGEWRSVVDVSAFTDVDTLDDAAAAGVRVPGSPGD